MIKNHASHKTIHEPHNLTKPKRNLNIPLAKRSLNLRHIDCNHLNTFYFVVTCKSISKAAQYLHLSQPALSRTITNFERTLSEKLLIRGARRLSLTPAGEIIYKFAAENVHQLQSLVTQLQEHQDDYKGDIHLWAGGGFLHLFLMNYIPDFMKQYPEICLRFSSSKTIPELDLIEADVVIRPPFPNRSDLTQIPLLINHVQLYASQAYLDEFGTPRKPQDLDRHRLIAYGRPPGLIGYDGMNWHLKAGCPRGKERKAFIEVDLPEDRLQLAAAGLGITAVSREHPNLDAYGLVQVLKEYTDQERPIVPCYFIYSTHLQVSKRFELFKNYLIECFTRDYGPPLI